MSVIEIERLAEQAGAGRLGRHREHDDRSRAFAIAEPVGTIASVKWERRAPILDQGNLGSCTGNAMAGLLGTDAVGRKGDATVNEDTALELYSLATRLDRYPGAYPPIDTGSSGVAVAKAARKLGRIAGYKHAFSLRAALHALQSGPVIVGMAWLTGCDSPDGSGLVQYSGDVRGGHELLVREYDAETQRLKLDNSWGLRFGVLGSFLMTVPDFGLALRNGGDVTQPVWA